MFWIIDKIDQILRGQRRLDDDLGRLVIALREQVSELIKLESVDRGILSRLDQIIAIFTPRPVYAALTFDPGGDMPLQVGNKTTATVVVLDQFGQPMPNFDFTTNKPIWSLSDPNSANIADGPSPDTEIVNGNAAGTNVLTVQVPGVANGSASLSFSVVAAAPVPTSVRIATSPDISG